MADKLDIEKLKADRNIKGLIAALKDRNWEAFYALKEINDPSSLDPLIEILKTGSNDIQEMAIGLLGEIGGTRAVDPIIEALQSKNRNLQVEAVKALGNLGDARVVEPLITALKSENRDLQQKAVEALGKIGDVRAVEPLIAAFSYMYDNNYPCNALAKIGKPAVEPLLGALSNKRSSIRFSAIYALRKIKDRLTVLPIIGMLKDPDVDVRECAANTLGVIGDSQAILALVETLMEDNRWQVQMSAGEALKDLGWQPTNNSERAFFYIATRNKEESDKLGEFTIQPYIAMLNGDSRWRATALTMLKQINWKPADNRQQALYLVAQEKWDETVKLGRDAIPFLIDRLSVTESKNTYKGATQALVKIGDIALEPLIEALKQSRYPVAEALGEMGDARAVDPLIEALEDGQVQTKAAKALGKIGDPHAVEPLISVLKSHNSYLVQSAVEALGDIGDTRAKESLSAIKTVGDYELSNAIEKALQAISTGRGSKKVKKDDTAKKPVETMSPDEIVDLLVELYRLHSDGFMHGSPEEKPIIEIGKILNRAGGKKLMLYVHQRFAAQNRWCARNLESAWDGIGEWMG
jgi:HEAT repeat protein